MVDKPKKKTAKAKRDPPGVLGGLPSERPARIGTRPSRPAASPAAAIKENGPKATAKPSAAARKPRATASRRKAAAPRTFEPTEAAETAAGAADERSAGAKPAARKPRSGGAGKPRSAAARRKAAAPRTFEPTEAAETAVEPAVVATAETGAGSAAESVVGAPAEPPEPERTRPRPVRAAVPKMGATTQREQSAKNARRPSGTELVTTAVQAAGELAQVGLTIGGQLIKRALDRVPRP